MEIRKSIRENIKSIVGKSAIDLSMGKTVVFPTDTSYGLAVDATKRKAVKRLYQIKGRSFKKPVHIVVASRAMAKQFVQWNSKADALAKSFWPGALTLVLPLSKAPFVNMAKGAFDRLTAGTGFLGVRMPDNKLALALAKNLKSPITATSANVSDQPDCYSIAEVLAQYKGKRNKPDIIIDTGTLLRNKPSTVVKIENGNVEILREGPITKKQILKALEL